MIANLTFRFGNHLNVSHKVLKESLWFHGSKLDRVLPFKSLCLCKRKSYFFIIFGFPNQYFLHNKKESTQCHKQKQ